MSSIIPKQVWAVDSRFPQNQYIGCTQCGPSNIPEVIYHHKGDSLCGTHLQTIRGVTNVDQSISSTPPYPTSPR